MNRVAGEIGIACFVLFVLDQDSQGLLGARRREEIVALIVELIGMTGAVERLEPGAVGFAVEVVAGSAEQMFPSTAEQGETALQA